MKVTVTEPKSWKRVLEIEVPGEQIQEKVDAAYKQYRKEIALPGFRRGKVPIDVLKARFGSWIRADVLEKMVPEFYEQARQEHHIVPISQPVIEDMAYEEGEPLRFRAVVEVKPPIHLKEYKGIRVFKKPVHVTEEDIQKALDVLRDRYAHIVKVEDAAEPGHFLLADMQELDRTGIPIVGHKREGEFFQIGESDLGDEFDTQLIGVKAGEERRIFTAYPNDYENRELAGQQVHFMVKVREVLAKQLPELDDDFAVDAGAENLDDLKNVIRQDLEAEPDREMRQNLIQQLVDDNHVDIPESMLSSFLDRLVADARHSSREPVDEDGLRQRYRPFAIDRIKRHLILDEIAEREHITVTQEEIDKRIALIAERGQVNVDHLKRLFRDDGRMERIETEIKEEKTIDFLVEQADIQVG